jgi:nitroreductase
MAETLDVIKRRRCIRKYKEAPVQSEGLLDILEAARWAPSGFNSQPWKFVVVQDRETLEKIRSAVNQAIVDLKLKNAHPFPDKVPCAVIACADPRVSMACEMETAMAVQNMLLEATSHGLGSCILLSVKLAEKSIKKLLEIPDKFRVVCAVTIGYADEAPVVEKKSLDEMVYHEKFGAKSQ